MKKNRKDELVFLATNVAKNKYTDNELMDELVKIKPTFEELIFMDDLIQNILEGEKENER